MASENEYKSLQEQLNRLNSSEDDVKKKVADINLSRGTGALNISVLDAAQIDPKLTKPARGKSLGIAMVLGLISGLGFACLRDWTDDRLRNAAGGSGRRRRANFGNHPGDHHRPHYGRRSRADRASRSVRRCS